MSDPGKSERERFDPDADAENQDEIDARAAELESHGLTRDIARQLALQEFGDERYKDVIEVDEDGNFVRYVSN